MSDFKKRMSQGPGVTGIVAGGNGIYTIGVGGRVTKKKIEQQQEGGGSFCCGFQQGLCG